MNVIVAGAGEVGFLIAGRFSKEGHNVTVIERDPAKEQTLRAELNAMIVRGSAASAETLEEAGIDKADLFIAVTDQDEVNVVACLLARESGCRRMIARTKSLEYTSEEWARNAKKLGIELLINPQSVVASEIYRIVSYPAASEVAEFAGGRVVFLGYPIRPGSSLAGVSMKDVAGLRGLYRMIVTAIARKQETIIPRGEDVIQEGDVVYFVCNKRDVQSINILFGLEKKPAKNVFILGGERVGQTLARMLAGLDFRVKLIERDHQLCQRLAQELDDVDVINTVGTDVATLKNEGIMDCDAYVAVTPDEETNILCSLVGKSTGAKRAIALVDRHEFVTLAPSLGVDACVSPRLATAGAILRYVRPSGVASMAIVEQTNSEVIEMVIPYGSPIVGKSLKELDVPTGAIIGVVVRGDQVVIPTGEDRLEGGDHVVVFALPDVAARVQQFFTAT